MIKSSIEKMAHDIGYDIGMSNDETQADLLNGFSKALRNSIQGPDLDMQLCYIVDKLDNNSYEVIRALNEFVILKEGNK